MINPKPVKAQFRSPEFAGDEGWGDISMSKVEDALLNGYEVRYLYEGPLQLPAPNPRLTEAYVSDLEDTLNIIALSIDIQKDADKLISAVQGLHDGAQADREVIIALKAGRDEWQQRALATVEKAAEVKVLTEQVTHLQSEHVRLSDIISTIAHVAARR